MSNIAIFASGSGTNAEAIVKYLRKLGKEYVKIILSNKPDAYVLERAKQLKVKSLVFNRDTFYNTQNILQVLEDEKIDLIILAGFLWLVPDYLIKKYKHRIINIHPALLPKHGGKGMYGMRVHEAVVQNCEVETGITIHYIDEEYDKGEVIFQAKCKVEPGDTPEKVAEKVHHLEYEHFPRVIDEIVSKTNN
jgi:phosphoribosylglycinamide formyltransferase-1